MTGKYQRQAKYILRIRIALSMMALFARTALSKRVWSSVFPAILIGLKVIVHAYRVVETGHGGEARQEKDAVQRRGYKFLESACTSANSCVPVAWLWASRVQLPITIPVRMPEKRSCIHQLNCEAFKGVRWSPRSCSFFFVSLYRYFSSCHSKSFLSEVSQHPKSWCYTTAEE